MDVRLRRSSKAKTGRKAKPVKLTATAFEALPDSEKARILAEIESQTPEQRLATSRPLTAKERAQWKSFRNKALRKRSAQVRTDSDSAVVSLSIEKGFLRRADAYAKRHGLGRSEMFVRAVGSLIGASK